MKKMEGELEAELKRRALIVTQAIEELVPLEHPRPLYEASRHLVDAGGKRLRPAMSGSITSSSTASGQLRLTAERAARPSSAISMSYPSFARRRAHKRAITGLSSTTRTLAAMLHHAHAG